VIGVLLGHRDLETAHEFFELFKTPWEPAVPGRKYRVLLTGDAGAGKAYDAEVVLVYSPVVPDHDSKGAKRIEGPTDIEWRGETFPIYGSMTVFVEATGSIDATCSGHPIERRSRRDGQSIHTVGYDLFREIRYLLTAGQPAARAMSPTLELHVALLRSILVSAGVSFVEVPPRPHGYDFICCLTHDLDFFGIRRHRFDRTMLGFLYRLTVGSVGDLLRGRRSLEEVAKNWATFVSMPFVFLGLAPDPWRPFDDYSSVEAPEHSTYFLVPFKGVPGVSPEGTVQPARAVAYQVSEVSDEVNRAVARGSEIAVHGIDAWRDSAAGRRELNEVTSVTGRPSSGVRMHWLYFDADSPATLEAAGFTYDSTWGYNDAIGYRAGSSQVFRLSGTKNLLELPLSIMDSALLFPNRMNLAAEQASSLCGTIVENARRFGGTVVVNWHDRSLAPERLWNRSYASLRLQIERSGAAWFATAGQAVDWYRWRRSIQFKQDGRSSAVTLVAPMRDPSMPAAVLKIHGAGQPTTEDRFDGGTTIASTMPSATWLRNEMQAS
jgi:hypothetical protein